MPAAVPATDTTTADLVVTGPAADLHAWLWGRAPRDGLALDGEAPLADDLRAPIADATQ